ncbi:MAG: ATP-binding protein [Candidatus Micrarchaeota archaeon]
MRFYDREAELGALEKACSSKNSEMIVISGRRRIGKSRLVGEFLANKEHVNLLAVPKEEKQVAGDFAHALADEYTPSFGTVKEALEYFFTKSSKRILFIDEFPNLLEVNPSIPYEFQRVWEIYQGRSPKVLIFSGSYASMMDRIFTRQKAPLFNRAGHVLILQPLPIRVIWKMQSDLGVKSAAEKIRNYCLFGGVPFYYELLEKHGTKDPVKELFFDAAAPLREEGQNILRQEFGSAYKKYFSIIEAIGAGAVSASEIAGKIGISQTTLSKYLMALQQDFRLIGRTVPFGQNPARSKKGIYSISDNLVAFWFSNVYGETAAPAESELNAFLGRRFETFCREFLAEYLEKHGETVVKKGKWWGQAETAPGVFEQREIDGVVETAHSLYLCECKWTNDKAGEKELRQLKESANGLKSKKPLKFVLFSKSGFNFPEKSEVLLFDAGRIGKDIESFP